MTTETRECLDAWEAAIMPPQVEETTMKVVQETSWYGQLFEAGSSTLNAVLTSVQALLGSVPWYGWALMAFVLIAVISLARPRKAVNVTNHYHRRARTQFASKRR